MMQDIPIIKIQLRELFEIAYEIAVTPNYNEYQRGLTSMVYKFSDKKTRSETTSNVGTNVNEVPAQELNKLVIKIF